MSDYIQVHLKGMACSGRGVRMAQLTPTERDKILLLSAKEVGQEGTMIELKRAEWKNGVHQMIKQVTLTPVEDPNSPDVKWKQYTPQALDEAYEELFTAKDHNLLMAIFRTYN